MTADHYLILAACALGISACVGWARAEKRAKRLCAAGRRFIRDAEERACWRIVHVDTTGRGPNADTFYHVPPNHDGRELWLTDEQVLAAKLRPDTAAKRTYETP